MKKVYTLLKIVCTIILFNFPHLLNAQTRFDDSTQLVALYNNNGGASWSNSANWLTTQPIDTWYGIHVSSTGRVDSISLPANNLSGTFPGTINSVTVLAKFDVSNNNLTGSMPYLSNDSMFILNVAYNNLSGPISYYAMPNLSVFRLNNNNFSTGIGSIGAFGHITIYNASHNSFTDAFPSISPANYIDSIDLSFNQLTGSINYYNYPDCAYFNASHNLLSGAWAHYHGLASPALLDVSHNKFTFNDLEPAYPDMPAGCIYAPQDTTLPLQFTNDTLRVSAGGTLSNNSYSWSWNAGHTTITGDSAFHPATTDHYTVAVTNAIVVGLTLYSDTIYTTDNWTGTVSNVWTDPNNWSMGALPTAAIDVIIPAGTPYSPVIGNSITNDSVNNLFINAGAILTVSNNDTLSVLGNISNSDTIKAYTGTLNIIGNGTQFINGINYVNNLIVNDNNRVTLQGGNTTVFGVYTPVSGTLVADGYLTLASNANGTALVAPGPGSYSSGNVTVQRYIPAHRAWRFLTAPISNGANIYDSWQNDGIATDSTGVDIWSPSGNVSSNGMLQGGSAPSAEYFSPLTNAWVGLTSTYTTQLNNSSAASFNNAFGVFVTGPFGSGNIASTTTAAATTLVAAGTLNTGTQTFNYNNVPAGNFILVGNPYASLVDFTNVGATGAASGNINNIMWAWDAQRSGTSYGGYVTFSWDASTKTYDQDISSGQTAQTTIIQNGQAVFVQADTTTHTNGTPENIAITFNETDKAAGPGTNQVFGGTTSPSQVRIALNRQSGTNMLAVDGVLVKYNNNYSAGLGDDADKLYDFDENLSLLIGTNHLAIERRPLPVATDTLLLDIYALKQNTNYSFTISPSNITLGEGIQPYLIDNYLKTATQLTFNANNTAAFSTTADSGSYSETRFVIVFTKPNALATTLTSVKAWPKDKGIQVQWSVATEEGIQQYTVEKSADGITFSQAGTTAPVNNNQSQTYNWFDASPYDGNNYYRIKVINKDGSSFYSNVVMVGLKLGVVFKAYPNPLPRTEQLKVDIGGMAAGNYTLQIFTTDGKQVMQKIIVSDGNSSTQSINLPSLATGVYQAVLTGENGKSWKQKLMLN